jgi:hypothetical protein
MAGSLAGFPSVANRPRGSSFALAVRAYGSLSRGLGRIAGTVDDRADRFGTALLREAELVKPPAARILGRLVGALGRFTSPVRDRLQQTVFSARAREKGCNRCAGSNAGRDGDQRRLVERIAGAAPSVSDTPTGAAVRLDGALAP